LCDLVHDCANSEPTFRREECYLKSSRASTTVSVLIDLPAVAPNLDNLTPPASGAPPGP